MAQQHAQKAHRIIRKLSEACDKLPSSLFITGVSGRGEHPTFGGGFGSVYRASYDNKPVALKVMRHFVQGSELREIRVVSFQNVCLIGFTHERRNSAEKPSFGKSYTIRIS